MNYSQFILYLNTLFSDVIAFSSRSDGLDSPAMIA